MPGTTSEVHTVFSVDGSRYQRWQADLLAYYTGCQRQEIMKQGLSFPLELLELLRSEEVPLGSARGGSGLREAEAGSDRDSGGPEEALDKAVGGLSEATGRATGDKSLEAEGRALRTKGNNVAANFDAARHSTTVQW